MVEFVEDLLNINDFEKLYEKEDLLLYNRRKGSFIYDKFMLGRGEYKISKSKFKQGVTMQLIKDLMYDPELRMSWDTSVKSYKLLEDKNECCKISQTWMFSPVFGISERDVIDKKIEFFLNGKYYNFASGVEDNFFPEQKKRY